MGAHHVRGASTLVYTEKIKRVRARMVFQVAP